jgi:hypothetical protein
MWADRGLRHYLDTYYFVLSRRYGRHRTDLSGLIDCSVPAVVLDVCLSDTVLSEVWLEPFKRYRFHFSNRIGRDVELLAYKLKLGLVPRFLRSFGIARSSSEGTSFCFHFYPGSYVLKDKVSGRALLRISVTQGSRC